jgi:hypothetical protein
VLGKAFCYKTTVFTIKAYVLNFLFCNTGVWNQGLKLTRLPLEPLYQPFWGWLFLK